MWFKFDRAYDFKPAAKPQVTIAYKPGTYNVTRECADKAESAGAGKPVKVKKTDGE
jgi:hypothetical protein